MEGTYEYELERAELLGVEAPSKEQWEKQQDARREVEQENEQAEIAQGLEIEDEMIKNNHGKMDELNSILSATQMKINKFKTVCGSFTSLLRIRTGSPAPSEDRASTSSHEVPSCSINNALDDLDKMKDVQNMSDLQFAKKEVSDFNSKATKNISALDSLLAKTEKAQMSMEHQNQQMKSHLRK